MQTGGRLEQRSTTDSQRQPAWDLVIFDLDGTLVDTRDGIAATLRTTLAEAGFPPPPPAEVYPLIGLPLATAFRRFTPPTVPAELVDELVARYRVVYRERVMPLTRPFPGVVPTLESLRSEGVPMAVATSKTVAVAAGTLAAAGLADYFALVLGVDSVVRPKPAPDMVLDVAAALGARTERTLVVGDTIHDVEMGRAAGAWTCAVTYGVQSRAELLAAGPDYVVDRIEDLLAITRRRTRTAPS